MLRVVIPAFMFVLASILTASADEIVTIAGSGKDEFTGDGGPALNAGVGQPFGLEVGPDGALYYCEFSNHIVRRLDLKTNALTTVAGTGRKAGYAGQFLTFSVVGIDPLFASLGKEIGGIVISQVVPSPRSLGTPLIKEYLGVLNQTDQTPSYESVEGYLAARALAEGVRRSVASGGKPDRAGLQKAFESMSDVDMNGFRVNLRPKKYESVRAIDLVTITPDGRVVR